MNNNYSVGDLMSMYYEREFLSIEEIELPSFSLKHYRKMKKIFKFFAKNKKIMFNQPTIYMTKKPLSIRKRILIAAIIIVCLAFITGCIIAFVSNSFRGTVHADNTHLFVIDMNDCPTSIEKVYTLSVVPEGYKLYETIISESDVFTKYKNIYNQELIFIQSTKESFNPHVNTEGYDFEELKINNYNALCIEYDNKSVINSLIIWDSSEYILELHGNFNKSDLVDLVKNNENSGF